MPRKNKVLWSEGMLLEPHHFQQHDRWVEGYVDGRALALHRHGWGYTDLEIDEDLLALGRFGLRSARGIFPDGTPFHMPHDEPLPPPAIIDPNTRDTMVTLALPLRSDGIVDVRREESTTGLYRYLAERTDVRDSVLDATNEAVVEVGRLNARIALASENLENYAVIPTARIVEVRSDNQVVLDTRFIPSVAAVRASARLSAYLVELRGLLQQRSETLAGRASSSAKGGAGDISQFLLLQVINRYAPLVGHLADDGNVHPERLYELLIAAAGELATLTLKERRPPQFAPYRHEALQPPFDIVIDTLTSELTAQLEERAVMIPLRDAKYGVKLAQVPDTSLLTGAAFVLAASGALPPDRLVSQIIYQTKIGSVSKIAELVNNNLPGVELRPLPQAPHQIPYFADNVYLEFDRTGARWSDVVREAGLALHVAGDIPDLKMVLWAIRGQRK
ncbi:MAG TPA: type VI secretion system baseplate subunit TssK [Candidatus Binatia bacterium]|nr:type VI secretion system baseplate subunit TssK [Candidatus Binatia bacterium]